MEKEKIIELLERISKKCGYNLDFENVDINVKNKIIFIKGRCKKNKMKIECITCGCVYGVSIEESSECKVTADLIECPMCFRGEEVNDVDAIEDKAVDEDEVIEEEAVDEVEEEPKTRKSKSVSDQVSKRSKYTAEILEFIKENVDHYSNQEMCDLLNKNFELNVLPSAFSVLLGYRKIKRKIKPRKKIVRTNNPSGIPRRYIKYTPEIVERIKEVIDEKSNAKITDMLRSEFGINVSVSSLAVRISALGIKRKENKLSNKIKEVDQPIRRFDPNKTTNERRKKARRKGMSEEAVKIIFDNYLEKTDGELRELIADKLGSFFPASKIESYRKSNGMARPRGWSPEGFIISEDLM